MRPGEHADEGLPLALWGFVATVLAMALLLIFPVCWLAPSERTEGRSGSIRRRV
jgi:hypothetical protein